MNEDRLEDNNMIDYDISIIRKIIIGKYEEENRKKLEALEEQIKALTETVKTLENQSFENVFMKMMEVKKNLI